MSNPTISGLPKSAENLPTTTSGQSSGSSNGNALIAGQASGEILRNVVSQSQTTGGLSSSTSSSAATAQSKSTTSSSQAAPSERGNSVPPAQPQGTRGNSGNGHGNNGNHYGHYKDNGNNGNQYGRNRGNAAPTSGNNPSSPPFNNSNVSGNNQPTPSSPNSPNAPSLPIVTSPQTNNLQPIPPSNAQQPTLPSNNQQQIPQADVPNLNNGYQQTVNESSQSNRAEARYLVFIVRNVLHDNGININRNVVNHLITGNEPGNNSQHWRGNHPTVSPELRNLVQNITQQATLLLNNSQSPDNKAAKQIAAEINRQFQPNLANTQIHISQNTLLEVKNFGQMPMRERMLTAAQLLNLKLPDEHSSTLAKYQPHEILSGLLLARGLVTGKENAAVLRSLISFEPPLLPRDVTLSQFRDLGRLVTFLVAETAIAKTPANLDSAVNKFIKLLIANNEIGVLTATINLISEARNSSGILSRSLALVQIYQLVDRLMLLGEKAMFAAKTEDNVKAKTSLIGLKAGLIENEDSLTSRHQNSAAESALKQFLEFNPAAAFDRSASKFDNPEQETAARNSLVGIYNDDIENWLKSGNHRLVKEVDFDKPLGIMAERSGDAFTVSKVRFVLVRDSSVAGWHFLKSSLVS